MQHRWEHVPGVSGFRVQGSGVRVEGARFKVHGAWQGVGFRVNSERECSIVRSMSLRCRHRVYGLCVKIQEHGCRNSDLLFRE